MIIGLLFVGTAVAATVSAFAVFAKKQEEAANPKGTAAQQQAVASFPGAQPIPANKTRMRLLKDVDITGARNVHGIPGSGLDTSGFDQKNIDAGQAGEKRLSQLIGSSDLLASYASFWSLKASDTLDTDVDCVLYANGVMWLLDAKNYAAKYNGQYVTGESVLTNDGSRGDAIATVDYHGTMIKSYNTSNNMRMAAEWYRKLFPGIDVRPLVLLCPTYDGSTYGIKAGTAWPGWVPVTQADPFISELNEQSRGHWYNPSLRDLNVERVLMSLVKW
jgi:hypothetical protein